MILVPMITPDMEPYPYNRDTDKEVEKEEKNDLPEDE